jgi:hypothetical protein
VDVRFAKKSGGKESLEKFLWELIIQMKQPT